MESETEFVGNRLQRQVDQLAKEKKTLAKERERLREKIQRLHGEGEKLRREKVAIEHSLETEEENIVNKLQAQIQKLLQQNVLLERKLNRLQGGNFAATSDSEQSEDGYSSTYSARAAYLSSSPRSTRSGTSTTRDGSVGPPGSRGAGHGTAEGILSRVGNAGRMRRTAKRIVVVIILIIIIITTTTTTKRRRKKESLRASPGRKERVWISRPASGKRRTGLYRPAVPDRRTVNLG